MPRKNLLPRRRPRQPSAAERLVGLILILVLAVIVTLFVLSGRRPGPPGLPETHATVPPLAAGLPPTTPGGWPRGTVETYDSESLFEKINGKADAYLLYEFDHLECATYTDPAQPDVYVDIYVYVMGGPLDAFGTYRAQRSGRETPLDAGDEAVSTEGAVFLRRGANYAEVVGSGPEARDEVGRFAEALGSHLEGADAVALPDVFPKEDLVIVRFDRVGAGGVDDLTDAFTAVYADGTQVVCADFDSPEAAARIANGATEDKAFLGEPATFVAAEGRVIGVVGPTDAVAREAFARELAGLNTTVEEEE